MSEDLREEIISLGIGTKIRDLRKKRGMTLARLGELCGLSVGFLSQLENEQVVPPLTTLFAISLALDVKLESFFAREEAEERISVVKNSDRVSVMRRRPNEVGYHYSSLAHRRNEKIMEPFFVEFEPRKKEDIKFFEHPGEEFVYILEGIVEFRIRDHVHVLEQGDSIYFDSDALHGVRGLDPGSNKAIVVVSSK